METRSSVIIIAGGMGDIGRATALKLAQDGHKICLLYHHTKRDVVEEFLSSLPGEGHEAFMCDLTDTLDVTRVVEEAAGVMGRIDICVHAAVSPLVRKRASVIEPKEFREQFDVTLFGGVNLFHAVIPYFLKQKSGRIIGLTTSAIESNALAANMAGYICAKHALRGLLRELARELSPAGITVNAVAPGFVPTALHHDLPKQIFDFLKDPERREIVTPEDVANVISFLAGAEASEISGSSFSVPPGTAFAL
jgi:3-oxoacyl-[acyl-carrier protein] reductase